MPPRDVCLDGENDVDPRYEPTTPAEEHDEWVSQLLYQRMVETSYLKVLIGQAERLCHQYIVAMTQCPGKWTPHEMRCMEMDARVEKEKLVRIKRVYHNLEFQICILEHLQSLFHGQRIDFST